MAEYSFHFGAPWWLFALLAIPLVVWWLRHSAPLVRDGREHLYADPDMLPLLTGRAQLEQRAIGNTQLRTWSLVWTLLVLAMAEPRYQFTLATAYEPSADLVLVLDISNSMLIRDVQPSRLERAKQEIQDLLEQGQGVRFGLVAFSSVGHVISPLTEDKQALLHLLPALEPGIARLQGSRPEDGLKRALDLLTASGPNRSQHILLLSDGDFAHQDMSGILAEIGQANIQLHALGLGTQGGGPVVVNGTALVAPGGGDVRSRLDETSLRQLAATGQGIYQTAEYANQDTNNLMDLVRDSAWMQEKQSDTTRIWHDYSPWLLSPAAFLLLWLYGFGGRRKA